MSDEEYDIEAEWLDWARYDVKRDLCDRGWEPAEATAVMAALPDEVLRIIRSKAVHELAECYIAGMRATIRIREAMTFASGLYPPDTERSVAARQRRAEGLAALSRRDSHSTDQAGGA